MKPLILWKSYNSIYDTEKKTNMWKQTSVSYNNEPIKKQLKISNIGLSHNWFPFDMRIKQILQIIVIYKTDHHIQRTKSILFFKL